MLVLETPSSLCSEYPLGLGGILQDKKIVFVLIISPISFLSATSAMNSAKFPIAPSLQAAWSCNETVFSVLAPSLPPPLPR